MSGLNFTSNIAAVILAAGTSSRMEGVKQLLPWKNTNLLSHVIEQLNQTKASRIFVVLGAYQDEILNQLDTDNITVVINENWSLGMGSSISRVVKHIEEDSLQYEGLLLTTSDQPLIDVNTYNKLISSSINNNRIVATSYAKGFGIPAVFDKSYFAELKDLSQDKGAKSVIKNHLDHLILVDDPMAEFDLDTKGIYEEYYRKFGQ